MIIEGSLEGGRHWAIIVLGLWRLMYVYSVKKVSRFFHPQPGCHLPNSPWPGIMKLFPARESLASDIPAGDGKIAYLFYSVSLNFATSFLQRDPLSIKKKQY